MLNEKTLEKILGSNLPPLHISDIHWKSQESDKNSILFYKINNDEKSEKNFIDRIDASQFAWLIVNKNHPARPLNSSVIDEKKWPQIQKDILDILYPQPKLKLMAVTGTNGKTTTADLVLQLGELIGKKGLSIGTLGVRENQKTLLDFGLTSPSLIDLRKFLNIYGKDKDFCILEASSHALSQQRLYGLSFDMAGWLSFSQDHLDYHQTMEEYFAAKLLIVDYLTPEGRLVIPSAQKELFQRISKSASCVVLAKTREEALPLFLSASFNRQNLEVAFEMISRVFPVSGSVDFSQLRPTDGRFYIKPYKTNYIVVDFAHTPDALENICRSLTEAFPTHNLKILFGCGGDRDRSKRPLMGKVAANWGAQVYVTSDNPRSESPELIIKDITQDLNLENIHQIIERPEAVKKALEDLSENEILLLAGKGHENYILKNGIKYPYSDIEEVENFLRKVRE